MRVNIRRVRRTHTYIHQHGSQSAEEKTRIAAEKNKRRLEKLAALSPEEAEKLRLHNERIAKREADKKDRLRAKKARANEAKWEAQENKSEKRKSKPKETAAPP